MKKALTFIFIGCLATLVHGQIYVKANATGANNGTSWANAYTSLGTALDAATNGSQVWVAAGTYKPDRDSLGNLTPADNRNKTFVLKNGVALYGGFVGTETILTQRNVAANATILSGDIGVQNDSTDNIYHILQVRNLTTATRLDGVTVTLAFTALFTGGRDGSALNVLNGDMYFTIANCIFSNNSNFVAVYCTQNSGLNIENTIVSNNYNAVSSYGGAIYCDDVNSSLSVNMKDCTFTNNFGGLGGAIATKLKMTAINCEFTNNRVNGSVDYSFGFANYSGGQGGAIYSTTDLDLTGCVFYNCVSFATVAMDVFGGAIYQEKGDLTLNQCGFLGNTVYCRTGLNLAQGGGVYTKGMGTCIINGCLFYSNYAQGSFAAIGAGVYSGASKTSVVTNSVFSQNQVNALSGANGGGGFVGGSNSTITNCTFTKNKAGYGAGILTSGSSTTNIKNTILWGNVNTSNTTDDKSQINSLSPSVTTISYSLIQLGVPSTVTNGGNNLSLDPLLVDINSPFGADGNWPTADDGLILQANSPAATKGTTVGAPLIDVLGITRMSYNSMGAYQKNGIIVPVTLKDFSGKVVSSRNVLTWETASEINNLGFDIERSADGISFNKMGFIKAKGQNATYDFTDNTPLSITYYRLRQKDFDGAETLSKIITLKQISKDETRIYPNPAHDFLRFEGTNEAVDVEIMNMNGQVVLSMKNVQAQSNIDVSTIKTGHYILTIRNDKQVSKHVFVKI